MRGSRYHGWAAKKHKGKGNVGGKGMAGSGKRADQKKTFINKYFKKYFGKAGLKKKQIKIKVINLDDIMNKYKDKKEIKLPRYKVLGRGEINKKIIINAKFFSKSAKDKIEKAGGKAVALGVEKKKEIRKKIEKQKKVKEDEEDKKEVNEK